MRYQEDGCAQFPQMMRATAIPTLSDARVASGAVNGGALTNFNFRTGVAGPPEQGAVAELSNEIWERRSRQEFNLNFEACSSSA